MSKIDLSLLEKEFGYVPSFHDAHVIGVSSSGADLTVTLYVYDTPAGESDDKHVIASLHWKNIRSADLFLTDHWLDEMRNVETSDGVRSELIDQATGMVGVIEAESLAVSSIEPPKEKFQGPNGESIKTIKFSL